MKVGREEIVGLIVALQRFAAGSDEVDIEAWHRVLDVAQEPLDGMRNATVDRITPPSKAPSLSVSLDEGLPDDAAYRVVNRMLEGAPAIAVTESKTEFGIIGVQPQGLTFDEAGIVGKRLREEIDGLSA